MSAAARCLATMLLATLLAAAASAGTLRLLPAGALAVVDGDTVRLDGRRLRLVMIDAPEIHQPRCRAERRAGMRARARLANLVAGRPVLLHDTGRIDPYGRPLVALETDRGDLGQILLAEGLALPWHPGAAARATRIAHWCGG